MRVFCQKWKFIWPLHYNLTIVQWFHHGAQLHCFYLTFWKKVRSNMMSCIRLQSKYLIGSWIIWICGRVFHLEYTAMMWQMALKWQCFAQYSERISHHLCQCQRSKRVAHTDPFVPCSAHSSSLSLVLVPDYDFLWLQNCGPFFVQFLTNE